MSQHDLTALTRLDGAEAHLARARRIAGAVPDGAPDPSALHHIGVLGAGAMGRGIAMAMAQSGRQVVLADPSAPQRSAAADHLRGLAERARSKGRIASVRVLTDRITLTDRIADFAPCQMVIEAAPERLDLKQQVLNEIESVTAPTTIVTSNTSTLDVDALAGALTRPGQFAGTHFFMPAQVNPLLELVPALTTADSTVAAILALSRDLGKHAVIAANGDGFIGNRLFDRFHQEAMYLVEDGAWPGDVDRALEDWGMAIGPFRALDLVGNDIPWGVRRQRAARDLPPPQPRIGDALCEAGFHGQKAGRGWYLYDAATPKGRPYEELHALVRRESRALGITRRRIDTSEILTRCLTALMTEACCLLDEGRAARASDIDMVNVTGYGFPPALGGPMYLAQALGQDNLSGMARDCARLSRRDDRLWQMPLPLPETTS